MNLIIFKILLFLYLSFCKGAEDNQNQAGGSSPNSNENRNNLNRKYWSQFWNSTEITEENNLTLRAQSISSFLKLFMYTELSYNETKNIFEQVSFDTKRVKSLEEKVQSLGETFGFQLKSYNVALERLADSINSEDTQDLNQVDYDYTKLPNCCDIPAEKFEPDKNYRIPILQTTACWTASSKGKPNFFIPNQKFTQAIHENLETLPYIKWMYFLSPEGTYIEYPANNHNCKNQRNNSKAIGIDSVKDAPERKLFQIQKSREDMRVHRIVFVIELGSSPSADTIRSLKNIVLMLLKFLDETDEVAIINSELDQASFLCDQLVPLTAWTRYQILNYLNKIELRYKSNGYSQQIISLDDNSNEHSVSPIQKAVLMACANFSEGAFFPPPASTIIHLTAEEASNEINFGNLNVSCPIFIETYFLRNLSKTEELFYKKSLQTIETKNILRVEVFSSGQIDSESFAVKVALKLNSKKEWWSLSDILSNFFPQEKWVGTAETSNDFSLPQWNPITQEPVLLAKKYVLKNRRPFGLLAIEIPLHYFAQHIHFFVEDGIGSAKNYAFLIDKQGRVVYHPSFEKPDTNEDILSIRIEQVEVYHGFHSVRKRVLGQTSGCFSLQLHDDKSTWITYAWTHVEGYIICIVAYEESGTCIPDREEMFPKKSAINPKSTDIQHYLLLQESHCCSNRTMSMNQASLYLAPSAFNFPASTKVTPKLSQALMAYLSDSSGMLKNQNRGLKSFVKDYIGVVSNVVPFWKQNSYSDISKYVANRFVTGAGGTFLLMYPGKTSIPSSYLPHRTEWYQKAVSNRGKLVLLPPTVDLYGTPRTVASVLLTATSPEKLDSIPVAVLGLTLNYGFLRKIIEGVLPNCEQGTQAFLFDKPTNITRRCFLIDENGYVVYHPHLLKTLNSLPKVHFTQVEPLTAIDLLQYRQSSGNVPMRKTVCHKLGRTSQGSLHRQYTMNIEPLGVQKYKYGDLCSRYQIIGVPETNLLLGIVEDGCENLQAFCPCSTVDNLCLNCIRIEKTDCECPCECPREPNICSYQDFSDLPQDIVPCEFPMPDIPMTLDKPMSDCTNDATKSNNCDQVWLPCANFTHSSECVGAYDCEWCTHQNREGCYTFKKCLGFEETESKLFRTGDVMMNSLSTTNTSNEDTQIILPVLGVLSVFIVFLLFVFYCYHRNRALNSSSSQPDLRLLPLDDGSIVPQAPSSQAEESEDDNDYVPVAVVRLRRSRRFPENRFFSPPRSPSSDHGYSTMTHGGESEVSGPVLDQNSVPRSLYTGQSNPDFPAPSSRHYSEVPTTSIPSNHHQLIAVTVHEELVS